MNTAMPGDIPLFPMIAYRVFVLLKNRVGGDQDGEYMIVGVLPPCFLHCC